MKVATLAGAAFRPDKRRIRSGKRDPHLHLFDGPAPYMYMTSGKLRDKADFERFCEAEFRSLVRLLRYCGLDGSGSQDLAQEALARTWQHWTRVSRMDYPPAWTRRVALNLARSKRRRLMIERRVLNRMTPQEPAALVDHVLDSIVLTRAISALPGRQRDAVVLRHLLDLPYAEVADALGVPISTAKSLVQRGVKRLRREEYGLLIEAKTQEDERLGAWA